VYQHILVAVEHSKADEAILEHIVRLARLTHARLLLVHVADGFAARHFDDLQLRESEEMRADRAYLDRRSDELRKAGFDVTPRLAMGDPATEIIKIVEGRDRPSRHRPRRALRAHLVVLPVE
jgi:nucleotide-binding universal stress UspA family protein